MAKKVVFSVYDSKVGAWMEPFFADYRGRAIRSWETACMDEKHDFNRYSSDYSLFEIGTYDQETGQMESLKTFIPYGTALETKARQSNNKMATIEPTVANQIEKIRNAN